NRKGEFRTYTNLLATFLIGGLWHGAGWTFITWGALHGIALAIHRFWQSLGFKMNKILAWFITFNFINITWIFFRAKDFESAIKVLKGMFGINDLGEIYQITSFGAITKFDFIYIFLAFIVAIVGFFFKNSSEYYLNNYINKKIAFYSALLFSISIMYLTKITHFLYFNF
ncbi:MBOAT family O-acyltransferase, partial [Aliarcobacter cryaerophilus]|uniref:MBOAT family O-acyltransferase n=1 Tax=Aliarcobacter cryaerophilus TaxID=28198 RepID=UPI003DA41015